MVNIFDKSFWGPEETARRNSVLGGMLQGSLAAEAGNASTGGLIGSVALGNIRGQQGYAAQQAAAAEAQRRAQLDQDKLGNERARILLEQQRIRNDQAKIAQEVRIKQRANEAFTKMFPDFGPQEQTEDQMPAPMESKAGRYDKIRKSSPLFRDFTDSQIDEMQRAGALAMSAGDNPMKAMLDASKSISNRDNISIMSPDEAMDVLGSNYDPSKTYKFNHKTGNLTTVGGGGVEVNVGTKLTDKMNLEHYKRRMRTQDKTLESGRLAASTANDMVPRLDMIISALESGTETGKISQLTMPLRGYLHDANVLTEEASKELQNQEILEAGQNYLISRVRPEGSGQTSDMEYTSFAKAVPGLSKTEGGNLIIAKVTRQLAQYKQKEYELMQEYLSDPNNKLGDFPTFREQAIGTAIPSPKNVSDVNSLLSMPDGTMFKTSKGSYVELTPAVRNQIRENLGE